MNVSLPFFALLRPSFVFACRPLRLLTRQVQSRPTILPSSFYIHRAPILYLGPKPLPALILSLHECLSCPLLSVARTSVHFSDDECMFSFILFLPGRTLTVYAHTLFLSLASLSTDLQPSSPLSPMRRRGVLRLLVARERAGRAWQERRHLFTVSFRGCHLEKRASKVTGEREGKRLI